ncbi:uncharacterized protein [Leptinotarsa decemlineata]|uniref:uncharacterized protein n=1 Tax=Leptinotarsa decemlineata TaxID=7539 RepID=UPI003D3050E5
MSDKKPSGHHHVCAVRNCYIKGYNSKKKFYRFPKDANRARIWAMKANREDLFGKLIDLHRSYSICEIHFEERMFTSHFHTRLVTTAIPTLFPSLEGTSRTDHSYSAPPLQLPAKILLLDDNVIVPGGVPPPLFDSANQTNVVETELKTEVQHEIAVSPITVTPPLTSPNSSQTSANLSFDTPRKVKYRQHIKSITAENKYLRERVQVLESQKINDLDNISLEEYMSLTFKFCNLDTAKCVNMQVSQANKHPKGRRYSKELNIECLSIYFAGPRVYKKYLMAKYSLPSPNTLLKEIRAVRIGPGLDNPEFFILLKKKIDSFQAQSKYCLLCFDEMSIKANLFYERNQDYIIGLAMGDTGEKIFKPTLTASVFMIRGIYSKWKQPIAYFLCHTSCPANLLHNLLNEAVQKLKKYGIKCLCSYL